MRAAEEEAFEEAAQVRDDSVHSGHTLERQHVVDAKERNRDIWALHRVGSQASITPSRSWWSHASHSVFHR